MPVPQVSAQALFNEAERHKSWESLEACLMNLLEKGQVLDYKHEGQHVSVLLNGLTNPVKLPVRFPEKTEVSSAAFEEEKPKPAETAPPKPAKKAGKAAQAVVQAPVGVVALVGLRTESYDHHVRRLLTHVLGDAKKAESSMLDWFRSLK